MCGCNKSKKWSSSSCKKYKDRLTKAVLQLKILSQATSDENKLQDYGNMISEIIELTNLKTCPKLSVIQAIENFIANEQNQHP